MERNNVPPGDERPLDRREQQPAFYVFGQGYVPLAIDDSVDWWSIQVVRLIVLVSLLTADGRSFWWRFVLFPVIRLYAVYMEFIMELPWFLCYPLAVWWLPLFIAAVRRRHRISVQEHLLAEIDSTHLHLEGEATILQREILAKYRAKWGIPILNAANLVMVRSRMYVLLKKRKGDMRRCDVELHVTRLTHLAFIPGAADVYYADLLLGPQSWYLRLWDWVTGAAVIRNRMAALRRPDF